MFHPARVATLLLVLVVALAGRAARSELESRQDDRDGGSPRVAVQHNTPITQELTQRWKGLPQVTEAQAGYDGIRRSVTAFAVCETCDRENVASHLSRDIWWSDLRDVTSVQVEVAHESDRGNPFVQQWDPVADAVELYDRYGNGMVDPDEVTAN